jgi:hypothetical protein
LDFDRGVFVILDLRTIFKKKKQLMHATHPSARDGLRTIQVARESPYNNQKFVRFWFFFF